MPLRPTAPTLSFVLAVATLPAPAQAQQPLAEHSSDERHVVEIGAVDHAFRAPDKIPSGWTTFRFSNEGEEPHFMVIHRLPDEGTYDEYAGRVYPLGNEIWYAVRDDGLSRAEAGARFGGILPDWWSDVERGGGVGLIAPGLTTDVTLHLDPGDYILECYVKTAEGELHGMEGMLRELTVTAEESPGGTPEADIDIALSNEAMEITGDMTPGSRTVRIRIDAGTHNVFVVRLAPEAKVQPVVDWMHWLDREGLWSPAPVTFVGGVHLLSEGQTGYFTVDLEAGRYLFISQYTGHRGVLREVTVEP